VRSLCQDEYQWTGWYGFVEDSMKTYDDSRNEQPAWQGSACERWSNEYGIAVLHFISQATKASYLSR